jgi:aqualysin 1
MNRSSIFAGAFSLVVAAMLAACGGGGSSAEAPASASADLQGVVVAGSAEGTKVFLDLNNNQSYDAGEPASAAAADGSFTLSIGQRTAGELASAVLVAEVPESARDSEDGGLTLKEAGRGRLHLMAPAAAFVHVDRAGRQKVSRAVISPLTTLVAAEVAFNGLTAAQAAESVQKQLGLGDRNPLADYKANGDAVLGNIARAAAITLGESPLSTAERAGPQLAMSANVAKTALPSVIRGLNLDKDQQPAVSVGAVKEALKAAPKAAGTATADASITALAASGNRFIVRFRDSVRDPGERGRVLAGNARAELRHTFSRAVKGFAVTVPADTVQSFLEATLQDADVDHVEADQLVATTETVQTNATWGLDRTDQRALPLSGSYSYFSTGKGVRAYIIDTGILETHSEVKGRVAAGVTFINDGRGTTDCAGHGTHVAGTVGGRTWGMAKGVTLVPVRVLDCNGSGWMSDVIAGIDWVTANAVKPAVINMSLGGGVSSAVNEAVANAVAAGITVSVAAGNSSESACNFSPASEPSAITVGATASTDARASFSNFGTCVDVFAPGASITSAGISSTTASAVMSGTSMAAPHVAGLAALYLQSNPTASPASVVAAIKAAATTGKVTDRGAGSPDALIYTDLTAVSPQPDPGISDPDPGISEPDPGISEPDPGISEPEPPAPPSVSVAALSGNAWVDSRNWRSSVTVAVKNQAGTLVAGAVVQGNFTAGGTRLRCTTAANGTCVINSGKIGGKVLQTQFSVTAINLSGSPYNASLNAVTSVIIAKP